MKPGDYGYTRVVTDKEFPVQKNPPKPPPKKTECETILRIVALKDIDAECIMIGWNPYKTLFFSLEAFYSKGFTDLKVGDRFIVKTDGLYESDPRDVYIEVLYKATPPSEE